VAAATCQESHVSSILAQAELADTSRAEPAVTPPPAEPACCSGNVGPILLLASLGVILLVGGAFAVYFLFSRSAPIAAPAPAGSDPVIVFKPKKIEI
jgi:hypothetical protein